MARHHVGCRMAGRAADGVSILVRFGTGHVDAKDPFHAYGGEGIVCLRATPIDAEDYAIGWAIEANSES